MNEETKYAENLALLARVREGDRSATEELVKRNAGLVSSIAYRFIGRGTEYRRQYHYGVPRER